MRFRRICSIVVVALAIAVAVVVVIVVYTPIICLYSVQWDLPACAAQSV